MERNGKYIGCIYCVTNILNNKKYIGQTMRSINRRWNAHKIESKTENNPSYFHKAILKYGNDNFSISELLSYNPLYKATTIHNCYSGNRQSAYNYIWKYA